MGEVPNSMNRIEDLPEPESEEIYCLSCEKDTMHEVMMKHKFKCCKCETIIEEVYCHGCSKAGGAERAIYHLAPVCCDVYGD